MTQIIPAAPGWYIVTDEKTDPNYDAVIAWREAQDDRGEPILLPYTENGLGYPPILWSEERLLSCEARTVYLPHRDPGDES